MRKIMAVTALLITGAGSAVADAVTVSDPQIFKAFPAAKTAAGYLTLTNEGAEDDLLIGVAVGGLSAMLHQSSETDGVARMMHVAAVEVPAGSSVTFERGGLHIMLMGLGADDLPLGEAADVTLVFESAGELSVSFPVTDEIELPDAGGS